MGPAPDVWDHQGAAAAVCPQPGTYCVVSSTQHRVRAAPSRTALELLRLRPRDVVAVSDFAREGEDLWGHTAGGWSLVSDERARYLRPVRLPGAPPPLPTAEQPQEPSPRALRSPERTRSPYAAQLARERERIRELEREVARGSELLLREAEQRRAEQAEVERLREQLALQQQPRERLVEVSVEVPAPGAERIQELELLAAALAERAERAEAELRLGRAAGEGELQRQSARAAEAEAEAEAQRVLAGEERAAGEALAEQLAALASDLAAAQERCGAGEREAGELRAQGARLAAELAEARAAAEAGEQRLQQELAEAQTAAEAGEQQLAEARAAAEAGEQQLQQQLAEARAAAEVGEQQLAAARAAAEAGEQRLQQQLAAEREEAEAREQQLRQQLAAERAAAEAGEQQRGALAERLAAAGAERAAAEARERELGERLQEADAGREAAEARLCELREGAAAAEAGRSAAEARARALGERAAAEEAARAEQTSERSAAAARERELGERLQAAEAGREAAEARERGLSERAEAAEGRERGLSERVEAAEARERERLEAAAREREAAADREREWRERVAAAEAAREAAEQQLAEATSARERLLAQQLAAVEARRQTAELELAAVRAAADASELAAEAGEQQNRLQAAEAAAAATSSAAALDAERGLRQAAEGALAQQTRARAEAEASAARVLAELELERARAAAAEQALAELRHALSSEGSAAAAALGGLSELEWALRSAVRGAEAQGRAELLLWLLSALAGAHPAAEQPAERAVWALRCERDGLLAEAAALREHCQELAEAVEELQAEARRVRPRESVCFRVSVRGGEAADAEPAVPSALAAACGLPAEAIQCIAAAPAEAPPATPAEAAAGRSLWLRVVGIPDATEAAAAVVAHANDPTSPGAVPNVTAAVWEDPPTPREPESELVPLVSLTFSDAVNEMKEDAHASAYCVVRGDEARRSMSEFAHKLEEWYREKEGDVVDELLRNLRFPPAGDPVLTLAALGAELDSRYREGLEDALCPVELIVLRGYTQRPEDIDRDLGFADVPPPVRRLDPPDVTRRRNEYVNTFNDWGWAEERDGVRQRNGSIFSAVCSATRDQGPGGTSAEWSAETLRKWIKWTCTIQALCSVDAHEAPDLWRGLGGGRLPAHAVEAHRGLSPGDCIGWPAKSSTSYNGQQSEEYMLGTAANSTAKPSPSQPGTLFFRIRTVRTGLPLEQISQYPSEQEHLLGPLMLFRVDECVEDPQNPFKNADGRSMGLRIAMSCLGPMGRPLAESPGLARFLEVVRADARAASRRLGEMLQGAARPLRPIAERQEQGIAALRDCASALQRELAGCAMLLGAPPAWAAPAPAPAEPEGGLLPESAELPSPPFAERGSRPSAAPSAAGSGPSPAPTEQPAAAEAAGAGQGSDAASHPRGPCQAATESSAASESAAPLPSQGSAAEAPAAGSVAAPHPPPRPRPPTPDLQEPRAGADAPTEPTASASAESPPPPRPLTPAQEAERTPRSAAAAGPRRGSAAGPPRAECLSAAPSCSRTGSALSLASTPPPPGPAPTAAQGADGCSASAAFPHSRVLSALVARPLHNRQLSPCRGWPS